MATAKEDVYILRSDLGPGAATFIAKGDEIPAELADLPRYPRDKWPPAEPKPKG
jgi:hypothetical protein